MVTLEKTKSDHVKIVLFGKEVEISLLRLVLLAWYEVGYINDLEKHIDAIDFAPIEKNSLRLRCGYLMFFKRPIEYREGFRYIPNFPRYAINKESVILDTETNKIITERRIGPQTRNYEMVYIRNPDKNGNRDTPIHRLLGLAWINNDDFTARPFINHKDGKRDNNILSNLEWCNLSENAQHALETGLNNTRLKMKSRDVTTGEVIIFNSLKELGEGLGLGLVSATRFERSLPGHLYKNRYEIKRFDDNSPWHYDGKSIDSVKNRTKAIFTIITIDKKTKKTKVFNSVSLFYEEYGISPSLVGGLEKEIELFKRNNPDIEISYERNALSGPYFVVDINNGIATKFRSIKSSASFIGHGYNELQIDLTSKFKFIYSKKWIIVNGKDYEDLNIKEYSEKPSKSFSVLVENVHTKEELTLSSLHTASKVLGMQRRTIKKMIESGKIFKGYKIRPLEQ